MSAILEQGVKKASQDSNIVDVFVIILTAQQCCQLLYP